MLRVLIWFFAAAYLFAAGIFLIGQFGLFGVDRSPLSGIYLIPLGLPWNLFIESAPEPAWPWLALLAPGLNLAILVALRRRLARRR